MDNTTGNIIIYALGISLGTALGRFLYIWVKRKGILNESNKVVVIVSNTFIVILGFVIGFITVVILYTILYMVMNAKF